MKNTKKLLAFFMTLAMVMCIFPLIAFAYGDDGDIEIAPMAINGPSAGISVSGKSVTYQGNAAFTKKESSIILTINLQVKRGSTWYSVDSGSKSVSNANSISYGRTKTVTGGYYYRCRANFSYTSGSKTVYSPEQWVAE